MKTYTDFDFINIFDEVSSYPKLLGTGWDKDNLVAINFKKCIMNFENHDIRFIAQMDPSKGKGRE